MKEIKTNSGVTRRDFIKTSAAASMIALTPNTKNLFAAGSDKIRVGLVGCGGRGTGAAINCVESSEGVEIVAMGDLFQDQLDSSLERFMKKIPAENLRVKKESCFVGFDAYKNVIASEIDLVILATPPHFRPQHLRLALESGKHVFMEKPVAVDPIGIRSVIESAKLATEKNLAIVAGTQRRHQNHYLEIMQRIHDGEIGELVGGQCYWNQGDLWVVRGLENLLKKSKFKWSDMEFQCRNWLFYSLIKRPPSPA